MRALRRDAIAIHVEAHREIAIVTRAQRAVEGQALEGVDRQANARGFEFHGVAQSKEGAGEHVDSHEGAAPAANVERGGSEETDSQLTARARLYPEAESGIARLHQRQSAESR